MAYKKTNISENIFNNLPEKFLKKIEKKPQPQVIHPMLATLTKDYFSSKDWLYEHKYDGIRCIAFKKNGKVSLMSRNNNLINQEYPEILEALTKEPADDFIIDGEIVALGASGISDFQLLQGRINLKQSGLIEEKEKKTTIKYWVFDLLYAAGYDTKKLPLIYRKKILKKIFKWNKKLAYSEHKIGDGVKFFHEACKLHWEGIMAKRADSEYVEYRANSWLKFKCSLGQELVIGGYTEPQGARENFGALLVGYYNKNKFIYAGKVGTGFNQGMLKFLGNKLKRLTIKKCPFDQIDIATKNIYWVKPILVAEFQFAQWTNSGKLRVGRFKGLRDDKEAKSVIRESPKSVIFKK